MRALFDELQTEVSPDAAIVIQDLTDNLNQVDEAFVNDDLSSAYTALEIGIVRVSELIQLIPEEPLHSAWVNIFYGNAATIQNIHSGSGTMSDVVNFFEYVNNVLDNAMNDGKLVRLLKKLSHGLLSFSNITPAEYVEIEVVINLSET